MAFGGHRDILLSNLKVRPSWTGWSKERGVCSRKEHPAVVNHPTDGGLLNWVPLQTTPEMGKGLKQSGGQLKTQG